MLHYLLVGIVTYTTVEKFVAFIILSEPIFSPICEMACNTFPTTAFYVLSYFLNENSKGFTRITPKMLSY